MRTQLAPSRWPHRRPTRGLQFLAPPTAAQQTSGRRLIIRSGGTHTSDVSTRSGYVTESSGSRFPWSAPSRKVPVTLLGLPPGGLGGYARTMHGRPRPRSRSGQRRKEVVKITPLQLPWEGGVPTISHLENLLRAKQDIREDYGMALDHEGALKEKIWEAYEYLRIHDRESLKQLQRQQFLVILSVAARTRKRPDERLDNVWLVVDDMKALRDWDAGIQKYEAAIIACRGGREAVPRTLALLEEAVEAQCRPTLKTYNRLLQVRIDAEGARSGEIWWESLEGTIDVDYEDSRTMPLYRDIQTANHLLLGYMKEGEIVRGWKFFREFSKFSLTPTDDTWNHLLFGYARAGDRESLARTLDEMLASGHKLNYRGYCIVIYGFSQIPSGVDVVDPDAEYYLRRATEAYDQLLKAGYRPGANVYSALMSLQLMRGNVDELRDTFADMQRGGVVPDRMCYVLLIRSYIFDFDMTSSQEIFDQILEMGVVQDIAPYAVMMAGYVKADKPERAVELFQDALLRGYAPDRGSYGTLINAYCEIGDLDKAYATMEDMEKAGIPSTEWTHLMLLRGHGLAGDLEGAEKIFGIVGPSTRAYNYIMAACVRCGAYDRALQYYAEMTRRSIEPNLGTFNILINTRAKLKDVGGAKDILRSLIQQRMMPDAFSIVPIMHQHATRGEVEEVSEYWNLLEKLRRPPHANVSKYDGGVRAQSKSRASNHVLLAMTNAKDVSGAVRHFRDVDVDRDSITYDILVRAHGMLGDLLGARRLLDEALEEGIAVDTRLWNSLLRLHLNEGDNDGVFDLLKEMQRRGHTPDMFTYTLVLKAKLAQKALEKDNELARQKTPNDDIGQRATVAGIYSRSDDLDSELDEVVTNEGKVVRQLSSFGEIPDLPMPQSAGELQG